MRSSKTLPLALAIAWCGVSLSAHRMDEYLQAARIAIDPDRVELQLDLTPGIAVVGTIIGSIDRDRDGVLSAAEHDAYIASVVRDLALGIDGQPLSIDKVESTLPDFDALRRGEGVIRLRTVARLPSLAHGRHALTFRNAHRSDVSVYLANALLPATDRVSIHAQRRDRAQSDLTIEYTLGAEARASVWPWALSALLAIAVLAVFGGARVRRKMTVT